MKIIIFGELYPHDAFVLVKDTIHAKNSVIRIDSFKLEAEREVKYEHIVIEQEKVKQDIKNLIHRLNLNSDGQLHDFLFLGRKDIPGGEQFITNGLPFVGKYSFANRYYSGKLDLVTVSDENFLIALNFFNSAVLETDQQDKLFKLRKSLEAIKNYFGDWKRMSKELLTDKEQKDSKVLADIRNDEAYGIGHAPRKLNNEPIPLPKYHFSWEEFVRTLLLKLVVYLEHI
jgi:hypothetical protein